MRAALVLGIVLMLAAPAAESQASFRRVCIIYNTVPAAMLADVPQSAALREGLRQHGWAEGRNIALTFRSAEGDYSRWPRLVDECLRLPSDVLVVGHRDLAKIAAEATRTIPIVFWGAWGMEGLVGNYARPGGNVTGIMLATVGAELDGKRAALLKLAAPSITKVGILWHRERGGLQDIAISKRWPQQASPLGLSYESLPFDDPAEVENVIALARKRGVDALIVGSLPSMTWPDFQRRLHAIVERHRLPAMHELLAAAETGGLMAYASDMDANFRRTGYFIDRILRGTKAGDIPIEQPREVRLHVNLKAARAIGLTLPPALIAQADRVID